MTNAKRWAAPLLALCGIAAGVIAGYVLWNAPRGAAIGPSAPASNTSAGLVSAPAPLLGSPAPDFSLTDTAGRTIRLASLRGRPVLLNFWAVWCSPCRTELPILDALAAKYSGRVAFLAPEGGTQKETVLEYLQSISISKMLVLFDPDQYVQYLYRASSLPTTFLVDSKGVIQYRKVGTVDAAEIESAIQTYGGTAE